MSAFDIAIVGAGAVGSATAHFLLSENPQLKVILIDKMNAPGRGSTGAWGSLIKILSGIPHVNDYTIGGFDYFQQFEGKTGKSCGFVKTGSLYFFKEEHTEELKQRYEMLNARAPGKLEWVGFEAGQERFPDFQWLDGDFAIFEAGAGYACPWQTTQAWIDGAKERGLEVRFGTEVKSIDLNEGHKASLTLFSEEKIVTKRILICAGPWSTRLLENSGISIPVTAQSIQVNRFESKLLERDLPFFLDYQTSSFARPAKKGTMFGGYCKNRADLASSKPAYRQPLSANDALECKKRLSKRLKWLRTAELEGGVRAVELYGDGNRPVMGFHPKCKNVYVATGWSCTGFVLAPVYGERIAAEMAGSLAGNVSRSLK